MHKFAFINKVDLSMYNNFFLYCFAFFITMLPSQASPQQISDLSGIKNVALQVILQGEEPTSEINMAGITERTIMRDVELELRTRGIGVSDTASAQLTIYLKLLYNDKDESGTPSTYIFSTHARCSQNCVPNRKLSLDPDSFRKISGMTQKQLVSYIWQQSYSYAPITTLASTWKDDGTLGIVGKSRLNVIRNSILEIVKNFENDYFTTNPR